MDLASPRIRVTLEQPGSEDYLQLDVQTDNRDLVRWDANRGKYRWPTGQEAPMLWLKFLAWAALVRSDQPVPHEFEAFNNLCVAIQAIDRDGNPVHPGTPESAMVTDSPTLPGPVTG